jgi:transposase
MAIMEVCMDVLLTKVAGIDVHKDKLAITILKGESDRKKCNVEQFECLTFTEDLKNCAKKLLKKGVKHVAMESTGIYWKPIYNVFHDYGIIVTLGNATHMKNVPGRKTDMKDSEWIAILHRSGLIRPSYIPEEEFQELRQLTRHRTALVSDISRVKNRVQKILEDGNVKLSTVLSDVFGVSGFAVVKAISDGITDAEELSKLVTTNIKRKEDIKKGLSNCLKKRHCFLIGELILQYMYLKQLKKNVDERIDEKMKKYSKEIEKLTEIPGINTVIAEKIIAEATTKMENFSDDRKFAAWSGVASGNNESGGKKKELKPEKEIQS